MNVREKEGKQHEEGIMDTLHLRDIGSQQRLKWKR